MAVSISPRPRWRRRFAYLLGALVVLAALTLAGAWWQLGRSLAQRDGVVTLAGLAGEVRVEFDAAGVPTIHGGTRADAARALGFVHAQERFFQMDLARRRGAGELAELFGQAAVATDRSARLHRFRHRADLVLAAEPEATRAIVTAYTDGVNAGLAALPAKPFEYYLIGQEPRPWTPADTVLVLASMYFTLQDDEARREADTAALREALPPPLAAFLESVASEWDTPMQGDPLQPLPPPGPAVFDLRSSSASTQGPGKISALFAPADDPEASVGSNNWAVAGSRTTDGHAIVANDMHLSLGVPNIWYRASLSWPAGGANLRVTGATLPGAPPIVVGSNGRIAWAFTNSYGDWTDRVVLTTDDTGDRYLTPAGWQTFTTTTETIAVAGTQSAPFDVRETIWGPVTGPDPQGRLHALAWVAHSPEGLNFHFLEMETAATLDEAMRIANSSGLPAQNCTMADSDGRIAWTIAGRIPRRIGFDGTVPVSWADGTRGWAGWYQPADYPRIVDPPSGVIVTANNRIVSDGWLAIVGDSGYDPGARARQIRDDLLEHERIDYAGILGVQLDDRALMLARWRDLALGALRSAPETDARRQFRDLVERTWTGRASIDSVGYRLVRTFRLQAAQLVWAPFVARARSVAADFPAGPGRGAFEGPIWTLLTQQPLHLLDPAFADWNALMLAAIDRAVETLTTDGRSLADRTWGEVNTLRASHPISRAVPMLSRWLDLPKHPLPGDSNMPRFQSATNGASERLAVSPGREADGYFHMPGGQSGHPRSPNFQDGHEAWATGQPTPFLPGPAVSTLTFRPR